METAIGSPVHVQWFRQASNNYKVGTPVPTFLNIFSSCPVLMQASNN
jgi:hypothetical protein